MNGRRDEASLLTRQLEDRDLGKQTLKSRNGDKQPGALGVGIESSLFILLLRRMPGPKAAWERKGLLQSIGVSLGTSG